MNFKRDNELLDSIREHKDFYDVDALIKKYESITYKDYSDRNKFNAEFVSDMVNDCGFDHNAIAEKMANEHPTLQQGFMRLCMAFINKMADKTYTDARNERSVELAKKIKSMLNEDDNYLPLI